MIVQLLELVPPEHLLLRLSVFKDYVLFARLYFQYQEHLCLKTFVRRLLSSQNVGNNAVS